MAVQRMILDNMVALVLYARMKNWTPLGTLCVLACLAAFTPVFAPKAAAQEACLVDYKAKRGPPLELHYGVMELKGAACQRRRAAQENVTTRLARDGWDLLQLMDIYRPGDTVTRQQSRKKEADAGPYFLRY